MSDDAAPHRAQSTEIHTFLIADVRGYTSFTLEQGDDAAARLASRFAVLVRDGVSDHNGEVIELRGDEALAVFSSARQALRASLDLQDRFFQQGQVDPTLPLRVGIGLDAGEAIPVEGGYRGAALNLAARLCALAGPGEVLASDTIVNLARKMKGLEYGERGMVSLKGFTDPIRVVQVNPSAPEPSATPFSNDPDSSRADHSRTTDESEDLAHDQRLPIGGFLGSLPDGVLVARDAELRPIHAAIGTVAGGEGRSIFLAGEPGVGKTRLAQEATLVGRNRGFLIAAGSCYEAHQSTAFYPFLEPLATIYAQCSPSVRARVPRQWPYLAALLPNENLSVPHILENQEDQERLFFAVTGFLQAVALETPIALLLDDLHWGDGSSLELLHYIAHHTRSHRVLIVGTYRDVEINRKHPLETTLRELSRQGLLERILVRRLPIEGMAALAAATIGEEEISDEFADLLYRSTEGNPFFVQQVLRVLVERGDVFQADGIRDRKGVTEIEVPESVRSVIGQRLG